MGPSDSYLSVSDFFHSSVQLYVTLGLFNRGKKERGLILSPESGDKNSFIFSYGAKRVRHKQNWR